MSNAWPYLVMVLILGGLLVFSMRSQRRKQAQQMLRVSQLDLGSEVMTTSGLYGTVVHRNGDGTVQLVIAPGVEVKWALAALRDVESLPVQYRDGITGAHDDGHQDAHLDAHQDAHEDAPAQRRNEPES